MIRPVLRRIQFDEHLSTLHHLAVYDMDRSDDASFIGLNDLGIAAGNDPSLGRGHNVIEPNVAHRVPAVNTAMMVQEIARPME